MMKNYMTTWALAKGNKTEGDAVGKAVAPFPREEAVISIYGRPFPHESRYKLKLMSQAVNVISSATHSIFTGSTPQSLLIRWITWTVSPSLGGFSS
jgi:hypothetical protein